ncbi:MAG: Xanthine permease [Candidatus Ozemobacter sibiricus]|jgi:xanthine permease XanP|uniref:Xanthine permease n=1 Tax=Candidatus Ozemobacter sibiricus TaxID=2268124 RepID=A0A367ZJR1_9BACT|nr:MAG: Xanthine permease [Candidatus Ozemobacter sibiricus]
MTIALPPLPAEDRHELLYGLDDRPPLGETLLAALQHLLAIFVPILTPGLIICGALGLDLATTAYLLNMSLFASGVCTLVQIHRIGPLGSGLMSIQGTSFAFIGPIIAAGQAGGLPLIFGISLAGSFIEMALSRFLHQARRVITPIVTGMVVTMIGLTLIKAAAVNCAGGAAAQRDGTFGQARHLGLAAFVLLLTVACNRSRNRWIRMGSIFIGLAAGYLLALAQGRVDLAQVAGSPWLAVPSPFAFGLAFDWTAFAGIAIIYLLTTIETVGDLTATSIVSRQPIEGDLYWQRVAGGVLADGFNSFLAAVFNSFPNTTFSQNNGIIQLTGVASRSVGLWVAAFLIVLGVFPFIGAVFAVMPAAVLGGSTLLMFGTIAANGLRIIAASPLDRRALTIIALSFGTGVGAIAAPEILGALPRAVADIFRSGITTGGLTAFLASLLLPAGEPAPVDVPPAID